MLQLGSGCPGRRSAAAEQPAGYRSKVEPTRTEAAPRAPGSGFRLAGCCADVRVGGQMLYEPTVILGLEDLEG
jgi:hypothetical protein